MAEIPRELKRHLFERNPEAVLIRIKIAQTSGKLETTEV